MRHMNPSGVETLPSKLWLGQTAIVAAPGPSLSLSDLGKVRGQGVRLVVVGDAWKLAPWACTLFHLDFAWWAYHEGVKGFEGEKFCGSRQAYPWGVKLFPGRLTWAAFPREPRERGFYNSGLQAAFLCMWRGVSRIGLLGFDMRGGHFFGEHPKEIRKVSDFKGFVKWTDKAKEGFDKHEVEVFNLTKESALTAYPNLDLETFLEKS